MAKLKTSGLLFIVSVFIVIFIVIGYFYIQKKEKSIITNAIEAVPIDAAYIIEIPNLNNFIKSCRNDSSLLFQILSINQLNQTFNNIVGLDSFIIYSKTFKELVKKEKIIVSFHNVGANNLYVLGALKIPSPKKQRDLVKEIYSFINSSDSSVRIYNNTNIYTIGKDSSTYYFSFIDNIFIISKSELLIENSIRHKLSNNPISIDLAFKQTSKTVSKNRVHLYVNYSFLADYLPAVFTNKYSRKSLILKKFANWSAFDVNFGKLLINMSGYTYPISSPDMFLYMFVNSAPQKLEADDLLPYKTAEFLTFSVADFASFYSKYEKYLSSKNLSGTHANDVDDFFSKNDVNIQSDVITEIGNSITFAKVKFNNTIDDFSEFVVFELKNKDNFEKITNIIIQKNCTTSQTIDDFTTDYQVDNSNKIKIFQLTANNFTSLIIGELVPESVEMNYFIFINNFAVFSNSIQNLQKFYYSYHTNKTLVYNEDYKDYLKQIPEKSNVFYYANNNFNSLNQINMLNADFVEVYKQNLNLFNKFQFITFQLSYDKKLLFQTHFNARYNPSLQNKGIAVWERELKSNVSKKPVMFLNHYTFEREVLIADDSNYIYLINKHGEFLWVKHLKEPFIDNFHEVDLYNNNKFQILLSTTNNLITFDRNGKVLMEKCVNFNSATTKGITVVDYDDNNDYRFFVPCVDKTVYAYDKDMQPITGWINPQTNTEIVSKVYYFAYQGKDYIVVGDKSKPYFFNRRGEKRIDVKTDIALPNDCYFYFQEETSTSKAGFITTDASGKIVFIDLLGNVSSKNLVTLSANHFFLADDLDSDNNLDYIFVDGNTLYIYKSDGSKIFSHTFSNEISDMPSILNFSNNEKKIGITVRGENSIYLFNLNGTIKRNFPLNANSPFSVGYFSSENYFSIVVGENNFLYNYLIY
ncbi:MAG: hypothetical protein JXR68_03175 [Bacteroidales bacterium]|nr:hypothetical protein [Bacteroidales bacterium]